MRTAVVLPAPLGPMSPTTVDGGTTRSSPVRALVSPKEQVSPSTYTANSSVASLTGFVVMVPTRGLRFASLWNVRCDAVGAIVGVNFWWWNGTIFHAFLSTKRSGSWSRSSRTSLQRET